MTTPDRRRFLVGLAVVGAAGLVPHRAVAALAARAPRDLWTTRLAALVPHTASAIVVGREYLRVVPDAGRPAGLAALLWPGGSGREWEWDVEECRRRVDRQVRRDFDEGRIVTIEGWMLSVTEAQVCALLAAGLERAGVDSPDVR